MLYLWNNHKITSLDMIIQLTTGNFLSFKEQSTLSLAASALKDIQVPAEDILFNAGDAGLTLM